MVAGFKVCKNPGVLKGCRPDSDFDRIGTPIQILFDMENVLDSWGVSGAVAPAAHYTSNAHSQIS